MAEIKMTAEVFEEIRKFNRNMEFLRKNKINQAWVESLEIRKQLTGWKNRELERARKNGYVRFKRDSSVRERHQVCLRSWIYSADVSYTTAIID